MDAVLDVLGKIGFDWQVALANLVNFLIIFFLLKRFAFGRIQNMIAKRQEHIKQGLDNRDRAEQMLADAQAEASSITMAARADANAVVAQAHERGQAAIAQAEAAAEQRAEGIIADAHKSIARDKAAMVREIANASSSLVVGAVEKIIDGDVDKQAVEKAAQRISDQASV